MRQVSRAALRATSQSPGGPVRLTCLGLSELVPPQPLQQGLFDGGPSRSLDRARDRCLNATLDLINARFTPGTLRRGPERVSPARVKLS